jgi:hypothetical protein
VAAHAHDDTSVRVSLDAGGIAATLGYFRNGVAARQVFEVQSPAQSPVPHRDTSPTPLVPAPADGSSSAAGGAGPTPTSAADAPEKQISE